MFGKPSGDVCVTDAERLFFRLMIAKIFLADETDNFHIGIRQLGSRNCFSYVVQKARKRTFEGRHSLGHGLEDEHGHNQTFYRIEAEENERVLQGGNTARETVNRRIDHLQHFTGKRLISAENFGKSRNGDIRCFGKTPGFFRRCGQSRKIACQQPATSKGSLQIRHILPIPA